MRKELEELEGGMTVTGANKKGAIDWDNNLRARAELDDILMNLVLDNQLPTGKKQRTLLLRYLQSKGLHEEAAQLEIAHKEAKHIKN